MEVFVRISVVIIALLIVFIDILTSEIETDKWKFVPLILILIALVWIAILVYIISTNSMSEEFFIDLITDIIFIVPTMIIFKKVIGFE